MNTQAIVGHKYVITKRYYFSVGDIVTYTKPAMIRHHNGGFFINEDKVEHYVSFDDVKPVLTPMQLAGYKIGDKFVSTDGGRLGRGENITFYVDDGSESPMFKGDISGEEGHKGMTNISPYVAQQAVTADITGLTSNQRLVVLAIIAAFKETK